MRSREILDSKKGDTEVRVSLERILIEGGSWTSAGPRPEPDRSGGDHNEAEAEKVVGRMLRQTEREELLKMGNARVRLTVKGTKRGFADRSVTFSGSRDRAAGKTSPRDDILSISQLELVGSPQQPKVEGWAFGESKKNL